MQTSVPEAYENAEKALRESEAMKRLAGFQNRA